MGLLSYIFGLKPTYAELTKKNPQLLSGEWSRCAHKKGFWNGKSAEVYDETGRYSRLTGDCKTCTKEVVVYRALE